MIKHIILAFQFLTIIPIKIRGDISEKDLGVSAAYFPLVGVFQGALLSFLAFFMSKVFSMEVVSGLLLLTYILTNGGFHLDGIADTFDALSVKSTGNMENDRKRRKEVMREGTVGAIGTVAIFMTLLLKFLLFREVMLRPIPVKTYLYLFLMPVFSKWTVTSVLYLVKKRKDRGLGSIFIQYVTIRPFLISTVLTILVSFIFYFFITPYIHGSRVTFNHFLFYLWVFLFVTGLSGLFLTRVFLTRFGLMTGDNMGAIHEITELVFLIIACVL